MRYDPITPTAPADRSAPASRGRRATATVAKLLVALLVFTAIVGGWTWVQRERERHSPLPNASGTVAEPCGLWFVGSSSMHKWATLQADMLPWRTYNRGVDGAMLNYLADRFASEQGAAPPRAIVFYGGENDIANGVGARETLHRIARIVIEKRRMYGALPMFIVSVKPSPTRWRFRAQQAWLNDALAELDRQAADIHFVDIVPLMLVDGRPGPFYQPDGIHLSHVGYQRWGNAVRDALAADLPADQVRFCRSRGSVH